MNNEVIDDLKKFGITESGWPLRSSLVARWRDYSIVHAQLRNSSETENQEDIAIQVYCGMNK